MSFPYVNSELGSGFLWINEGNKFFFPLAVKFLFLVCFGLAVVEHWNQKAAEKYVWPPVCNWSWKHCILSRWVVKSIPRKSLAAFTQANVPFLLADFLGFVQMWFSCSPIYRPSQKWYGDLLYDRKTAKKDLTCFCSLCFLLSFQKTVTTCRISLWFGGCDSGFVQSPSLKFFCLQWVWTSKIMACSVLGRQYVA